MVDSSKRSIPSWQRPEDSTEQSQAETEETEVTVEASGVFADDSNDRSTLLDEAKRFLEDSAVRNAAPEHKIAFLKSKGVKSKEIQELLETDIPKQQEVRKHSFEAIDPENWLKTHRHTLKSRLLQLRHPPKLPPLPFLP